MLIEEIIGFCDKSYKAYGNNCGCKTCNHPAGNCSGSCYDCLYQIHYPKRFSDPKKSLYDCQKMIYHYVCQYTYIYASEILYAFIAHSNYLKDYKKYNLMSIGCGACPDLMALEWFCHENNIKLPIAYRGYDLNHLWEPIHTQIKRYSDINNISRSLFEKDVISHFEKYYVDGTNVIVISYLISYLYNTNQISKIDLLFERIADNVVLRKQAGASLLIIINDVNSNKRGRDYFSNMHKILRKKGLTIHSEFRYFDNVNLNNFQKIGKPYSSTINLFPINDIIKQDYHISSTNCRSIQLIIEVK